MALLSCINVHVYTMERIVYAVIKQMKLQVCGPRKIVVVKKQQRPKITLNMIAIA